MRIPTQYELSGMYDKDKKEFEETHGKVKYSDKVLKQYRSKYKHNEL